MEELNNEAIDSALILENRLKERVTQIVERVVINIVGKEIHAALEREKTAMMTEMTLAIGKSLQFIEKEGRKPLWESTAEEFGFEPKMLDAGGMLGVKQVDLPTASPVKSEGYPDHNVELPNALQKQS